MLIILSPNWNNASLAIPTLLSYKLIIKGNQSPFFSGDLLILKSIIFSINLHILKNSKLICFGVSIKGNGPLRGKGFRTRDKEDEDVLILTLFSSPFGEKVLELSL